MIENILQETGNLIGSTEDIENLAHKDHARVLVLSDSHEHPSIFISIIKTYGKHCDALIFCGDGISDLAVLLNDIQTDKELKECTPPVIAFVRGNCDSSVCFVNNKLSLKLPDTQFLTVNNKKFIIVHGHREGIDFGLDNLGLQMQYNECTVAFYGHTHIAREDNDNGYKFVNPGSCARPRGGQPAGFAIATVEKTFVDIAFIKIENGSNFSTNYQIWKPIY